jgi:chloramphenicol-sensitive protein RarD
LPWIALTLAFSFGSYGFMKKRLGLPAAEGLFLESAILLVPAIAYLVVLTAHGSASFGRVSAGHTTLMVVSGVLTAGPLLLFAGAANRIPLTALGMLQYLTPTLQFGLGVLLFHEPMPPARFAGFVLVWAALAIFTWDAARAARRLRVVAQQRRLVAPLQLDPLDLGGLERGVRGQH